VLPVVGVIDDVTAKTILLQNPERLAENALNHGRRDVLDYRAGRHQVHRLIFQLLQVLAIAGSQIL
jgi:hypothetical protein